MKNKFSILKKAILGISVFAAVSCSKDDPKQIHDHEGIHEVIISVTESGTTSTTTYEFVDGQTLGETITLKKGKTYDFEVTNLNNDDDENIISEVVEEKDEHFFVYSTTLTDFVFTRTDTDKTTRTNGAKLGVNTQLTVNKSQTGNLVIVLKHQATSVSDTANNNLGSSEGGATDVEVTFPVVVTNN